MRVRTATEDDCAAIAAIAAASWQWAYKGIVPDELMALQTDRSARAQRLRDNWSAENSYRMALGADGSPVGFAIGGAPAHLEGCDCEIFALYVHPDAAGKGAGAALFSELATLFVSQGHRSMAIRSLRDNAIGRRFYDKMGGKVVGECEWRDLPAVWYRWELD